MPDIMLPTLGVAPPFFIDTVNSQAGLKDSAGTTRVLFSFSTTTTAITMYDASGNIIQTTLWNSAAGTTTEAFNYPGVAGNNRTIDSNGLPLAGGKIFQTFTYDFSRDGGAQGTFILGSLPSKFVVTRAWVDVITALTSGGGATGALSTGQGAGDLVTAAAVSGAPWSTTGIKATSAVDTAGSAIKMTASRQPTFVVATADLNGGKFNLYVEGFQSA